MVRPIPEFGAGDTIRVNVKVVEGTRERIQAFEGVCIARSNRGLNFRQQYAEVHSKFLWLLSVPRGIIGWLEDKIRMMSKSY